MLINRASEKEKAATTNENKIVQINSLIAY